MSDLVFRCPSCLGKGRVTGVGLLPKICERCRGYGQFTFTREDRVSGYLTDADVPKLDVERVVDLFDKLSIVNWKIATCVDIVEKCSGPAELIAQAGKNAQALNMQRHKIKNELKELLGAAWEELEVKL